MLAAASVRGVPETWTFRRAIWHGQTPACRCDQGGGFLCHWKGPSTLRGLRPVHVQLGSRRPTPHRRWTRKADRRYVGELDLLETTDQVHRPYVPTMFTLFPDLRIHSVYNPVVEQMRFGER
jgi:hypothetical protein